ncbi:MAG: hypothetical protein IJO76_00120 [Clostridia bacterium]|nr:hypothetical protein [Clostridia bacterium]
MKQLLNKILSPQLFAVCYLPWLAINMTSVVNVMDFTRVVLIAFAVWAVAICVKMYFFSDKTAWTHKAMPLLLLFLAACLFSQVVQFAYGGLDVIGKMCYFSLCILVLYSQHGSTIEDYKKSFSVVARVLGIVIGIMMAICDWMFLNLYQGRITIRTGNEVYLGFAENRLYGIFTSPNVGATYALILIWCSMLVFMWAKDMRAKWFWRVLSLVQIGLATMFVSVALSRGAYLSGAVMAGAFLLMKAPLLKDPFVRLWKKLMPNGINRAATVVLSIVGVAAGILICVYGIQAVNKLSVKLMAWNHEQKVESSQVEDTTDKQEIINNAMLGSDGRVEANRQDIDITNKRAIIWTSHLSLLKGKHLLIGVNRPLAYLEKNPAVVESLSTEQLFNIKRAGGNMHCGYLQMLVNGGLLAFIPMMVFLVWCLVLTVRFLIKLFKGKTDLADPHYQMFSWTMPMVLAILANNVFETNFVLMGANFFQAFFWFVAGACVLSMREGVKK